MKLLERLKPNNMRKILIILALLPTYISAQSIFALKHTSDSTYLFRSDSNCDTTILHKQKLSYSIYDFEPINDTEVLLLIKDQNPNLSGIYYKNSITNEFTLKYQIPIGEDFTMIKKLQSGDYALIGTSTHILTGDLSAFTNLYTPSIGFSTIQGKVIEPIENRIFYGVAGISEHNLSTGNFYERTPNIYDIKDFVYTENNKIIYLNSKYGSPSVVYISEYNLVTDENTKLDSIHDGDQTYEHFGAGNDVSLNYIGNNEIIITTINSSGIGISKYNFITKTIVLLHTFTNVDELFNIQNIVNNGNTLMDFWRRADVGQVPVNIIRCIPGESGVVSYSHLKCPSCTFNGVPLLVDEVNKNNFSLFPNPATSTVILQFEGEINSGFVSIYSISGQKVLQERIFVNDNEVHLSTSHLQSGIYFVELGNSRLKFAIE